MIWRILILTLLSVCCAGPLPTRADEATDFYQQRIEPALKQHCYECHSHAAGESSGQLMLDSAVGMTGGGTRGPAVVPGKPEEGWLIKAIAYADTDLQMPPAGKLPDEVIEDFRKWIASGATGAPQGSAPSATGIKRLAPEEATTHWAYVLPQRATLTPPDQLLADALSHGIQRAALVESYRGFHQSRIDALILSAQLRAGLLPSAPADRTTLARRLAYDLTGLAPQPDELAAYLNDPLPTPLATERYVDRLLASPHFGERWARYWMDVARYADTKGYVFQEDRNYPQAFKYRDWLISAFNADKPYTDFIREQLAGDTLDPDNSQGRVPALGFLTLGRRFLNNKNDIIDDRLDVTMRGLMGLTVACARCHDHKYDPVSQADYYSLYGVFLNTEEPGGDPWPHRLSESKEDRKSFVLIRGQPGNHGAEVPRKFISFMAPDAPSFTQGSGRIEMADRIVSANNPLTARVMANRVWMRLMGTSLVETPSDLGARCPPPKLQTVLDELAVEFIESNWSVKELIRTIVCSAAYQQASLARAEAVAIDPENSFYWRSNRRRMDFESLRDNTLAAAGQLDKRIGGASEKIHERPFSHRRTVYAHIDRQNLPGVFRNFDVASPDAHSPQRLQTTVPQQGLYILNSAFESEIAQAIGHQIRALPDLQNDPAGQVRALFERILRRQPDSDELSAGIEFLQTVANSSVYVADERWQCGYGAFDPESGLVKSFTKLPHLTENAWQGGPNLPDPKLGWCMLSKEGGHPGHGLEMSVVRRWIAPREGVIAIRGKAHHRSDMGDGIRATIVSNHGGKLGQWTLKQKEERTAVPSVRVVAGEVIDFVTDSITDEAHDSFEWKVRVQYQAGGETFDSSKQLPAVAPTPMAPLDQLAQALLASNEFAFVD